MEYVSIGRRWLRLDFPTVWSAKQPKIKRQAIFTKSACDLSNAFANRRRQRTLDNPLFVKPVNVSRFIDGARRCDWTYTATDFLQIWTSNDTGRAQSTVKEKNWTSTCIHTIFDTRPTRPILHFLSLLYRRYEPSRSIQICNKPPPPTRPHRVFSAVAHISKHKDSTLTDAFAQQPS